MINIGIPYIITISVSDVTYAEVGSFQSFIVNQAQLHHDRALCSNTCEVHRLTRMDPSGKCTTGICHLLQGKCDGSVMQCQTITHGLNVCNSVRFLILGKKYPCLMC